MFICKICGQQVEAGQAFCPKCGADVVLNYETVCPVCSAKNASGSRYCAKCGGILGVLRKPACAVCGAQNLPGAKFCVSCGAPILPASETHNDGDVMDARKAKQKLDSMERERMQAVDKEISLRRQKLLEEKAGAMKEVENERERNAEEFEKQKKLVENYRKKLNELGAEDLEQLKKISDALRNYSVYYADPFTEIDEDKIDGESFVCPACGTINPLEVKVCTHCGRSKARSMLLLAKGKIKQNPPVKRKKEVIPAPEQDLKVTPMPDFDEFSKEDGIIMEEVKQEKPVKEEKPADFSGPSAQTPFYGYPYPQAYPYPPMASGFGVPSFYNGKPGEPYQMPPILQPVAFVPYVTQDQPLMQYAPYDFPLKQSAEQTVEDEDRNRGESTFSALNASSKQNNNKKNPGAGKASGAKNNKI